MCIVYYYRTERDNVCKKKNVKSMNFFVEFIWLFSYLSNTQVGQVPKCSDHIYMHDQRLGKVKK